MKCNCLKEIDAKLKEKNLTITGVAWIMPTFQKVFTIETNWIDRDKAPKGHKRTPPKMHASHCPFCGVKLESDKETVDSPKTEAPPGAWNGALSDGRKPNEK